MVEDTRLIETFKSSEGEDIEEKKVETLAQVSPGENVRCPGSDVKKGDLVLQAGEIIHSAGGEIGTLAFVGRSEVCNHKKYKCSAYSHASVAGPGIQKTRRRSV